MMYPLVRELAADGIPVAVTCRVLKIARQPFYRWLRQPITSTEWTQAHLVNAIIDAHADDPEFGYRLIADEVRDAGVAHLAMTSGLRPPRLPYLCAQPAQASRSKYISKQRVCTCIL